MLRRAHLFLFISLLANAGASAEAADAPSAKAALQRLGVVTHLDYRGTPYENLDKVRAALSYIGLDTLRDMTPLANTRPYESLAREGFRFNFVVRSENINELPKTIAALEQFLRRYPGSIVSIEGLNEVKFWPGNYRGDKSFAGQRAAQCELFGLVNRPASNLRELPVLALTLGGAGQRDHDELGDLSDCADVGNAHIYFDQRPPSGSWDFARNLSKQATRRLPTMAVTETGYSTIDGKKGVSEEVQAKYLLFLAARALKENIPLTFFYQLVDDREKHDWSYFLGFYRYDWTPKPAAHVFNRFTRSLRGPAVAAEPRNRVPDLPKFTLTGDSDGVESLVFRRDDGSIAILLWRELDLWDPATQKQRSARARTLTLTIAAGGSLTPRLLDPLTDVSHDLHIVKSSGNNAFTVELIDRPVIVTID